MAAKGGGGGGANKVAVDFEKIIHENRDRKKNEALAARIFSKDRRSSAPMKQPPTQPSGGSLASRAGVKKQPQHNAPAAASKKPRHSTGALPHGDNWTTDLGPSPGSLASRISNPNAPGPVGHPRQQKRRAAQVAEALIRTEQQQGQLRQQQQQQSSRAPRRQRTPPAAAASPQHRPTGPAAAPAQGLMIRGLAGPIVVVAENFVEGTTAADIDSALSSTGGAVERVILTKTKPFVIAEILFTSKEGADRVVEKFDGVTADCRILRVYRKAINQLTPDHLLPPQKRYPPPVAASRYSMRDEPVLVDGTMGFDDPMEMDAPRQAPRGPAADAGGLYSDDVMRANRRGRGFGGSGRW
ncbi:hypothetical protein QBC39DRAFT_405299 [Podospora conica]|nr:hypothetical protein QBC39DRAFT_405299 [Schizothecium conicum]